jgi:hypothetical protein
MTPLSLDQQIQLGQAAAERGDIFVFGSNRAGHHGGGAAAFARKLCGAIPGQGEGRQGQSYAIPTMDEVLTPLSLTAIAEHVRTFLDYVRSVPTERFFVTPIGCGIAGYQHQQIAPFFAGAPKNCTLPDGWRNEAA